MKSLLRDTIRPLFLNGRGWRTKRKLLVIQSDDWGAIRTSGRSALNALQEAGVDVRRCHYTRFDALEGVDDLSALFEVLCSVRDRNGAMAKFTANCLVANPNFDAIRDEQFLRYVPESVIETFARSERTRGVGKIWLEGYKARLFYPQSHSREHFNVGSWMRYLQGGESIFRVLFNHQMYALSSFFLRGNQRSYLAALQSPEPGEVDERELIVSDGLMRFKQIFGFASNSFIAPNYVWDGYIENILSLEGVRYIQTSGAQQPTVNDQSARRIRRHQGEINANKQLYLLRNVHFEPSSAPGENWISKCLRDIGVSFMMGKPAIISTHRVNYIGALDEKNRERGLLLLRGLLEAVVSRWPDVEFLSTVELGDIMAKELLHA